MQELGWLNSALCWRGLTIFSKISYSVYLSQFLVFFYNVGTTKSSQEFNASTIYVSLFEFILVLLASTIMTLLFDLPMQEVKNIIMGTRASQNLRSIRDYDDNLSEHRIDHNFLIFMSSS
uniref:Uncharacterized protein n=1 Tax=Timema bartmani TaxID=61472 RepID=A0A7R9F9Z4_9NEOP|nr:unnamed protein product [Timema bartmani]